MSLIHVLLALLSRKPDSGYGLGKRLRSEMSHVWTARLQQIYSELARLEAEGLVKSKVDPLPNRPAKKWYSLTQAGYEELDRWLARPPECPSSRDELLAQLLCLDRLSQETRVRRLEEHRDRCWERLQRLRGQLTLVRPLDPAELGLVITLEYAISQEEARLAWAERALALLAAPEEAPKLVERRLGRAG